MQYRRVADVAFFLDSPRIVQCFQAAAESNPEIRTVRPGLTLEYLVEDRVVPAGDNVSLRFRLADPVTGLGKAGLNDVTLISFRTPGRDRRQTVARDAEDGVYEAKVNFPAPGVYYVYVTVPSLKIDFRDFVHLPLRVKERK